MPSDHTKWKAEGDDTVISIFSDTAGATATEESTECVVRTRTREQQTQFA